MYPLLIFLVALIIICLIACIIQKNVIHKIYEKFANMKPIPEGVNPKFYSNDKICVTPDTVNCVTNDSCAQYGIGETCSGPLGNKKCMCNSQAPNTANPLSLTNVNIKAGGVCSEDAQCETGYCGSEPGLFSKMCKCPVGYYFSKGKCVKESPLVQKNSEVDNFELGYKIPQVPDANAQVCATSGKLCKQNSDCSIGEGCNSNGMCICLLNYTNDVQANLIKVGGKCANSKQCEATSQCVNNECICPTGTYYNFTNNNCECSEPDQVYDEKVGCVLPKDLPRSVCNSKKDFYCDTNKSCGLGEYCDPVTRRCICNADIYVGTIKAGAKCNNNSQCESGVCDNMDGKLDYKVCKYIPVKIHDFALAKYAF